MQYILNLIPLEYYAFTGLLNFFTTLIVSILTILKNFQSKVNRTFSAFAFSVASWSIFYFLWLRTPDNKVMAEFYLRTCMIPVFFMPSVFYQFVVYFLNINYKRIYLLANYILSIVFTLTVYTSLYSHNPTPFFSIPYWMNAGIACHLAISHFGIVIGYTWYLLLKRLKTSGGIFRNQLRYVFVGTLIGFIGGSTNYFGWYKIPFPPVFNILVSVYMGLIAYAILKHRLMNIDVVIKKSVTDFLLFLGIGVISILIILGVESKFYQGINLRMLNFLFILLLIPGAYLFRRLKPATEKIVEKAIFGDKYRYLESITQLGKKVINLDQLLDEIARTLVSIQSIYFVYE